MVDKGYTLDDLNQILNQIISAHTRYYNFLPSFSTPETEIVAMILEQEHFDSEEDVLFYLEDLKVHQSKIEIEEWSITFDHVIDEWIFQKALNLNEIENQLERKKSICKSDMIKLVSELSAREFEILLYRIFRSLDDYEYVNIRPQSHDGGYEMFLISTDNITGFQTWVLIQAKHRKTPVSVSQVRELIGTLDVEKSKHPNRQIRGLMISLNHASKDAIDAARHSSASIEFIDVNRLVDIMISKGIGCLEHSISYLEIDYDFWSDWG